MSEDWSEHSTAVAGGGRAGERPEERSYVITVVEGPDQGASITLDASEGARALVGRGPACNLRLNDPRVSRRHAVLDVFRQELRVVDLESKNRTLVNGVPIASAFAREGDRVQLGSTKLTISRAAGVATAIPQYDRFGRLLGSSPAMRRLYPLCAKLAASNVPVLIEGETGTGKEVLAEALHEASPRAGGPFIVFDCTAVPPTLAESTLFGHERGSFTGATAARTGVFEEASGGTLLIDEIGELELGVQPKLLRALERGEVQRVGTNRWTRVDVRVIAATRRDLDREVQAGRFRDDLFFRLAVGRIELPPLRDRAGDVALLAAHFGELLSRGREPLPADVVRRFEDYRWPGNVRELHNAVARYLALGEDPAVEDSSALELSLGTKREVLASGGGGDVIDAILQAQLPLARAREALVHEFERRYLEDVLARHGGNVARAAAASGVARRYFQILRARHKG